MGLRATAAADLKTIVEDLDGFAWPISVTDPSGATGSLKGLSNDIALAIDPETGMLVSGRTIHVALSLASLTAASLGIPEGIADESKKPWIVVFDDIQGVSGTFKVSEGKVDRAIGVVVCALEFYKV